MERIGSAVTRRLGSQVAIALVPTFMAVVMSLIISLVMTTICLGFVPQLHQMI